MNKYSFSSNFLSVHTFQCKGPKTCFLYLLKTTKHNESFPVIGGKKKKKNLEQNILLGGGSVVKLLAIEYITFLSRETP